MSKRIAEVGGVHATSFATPDGPKVQFDVGPSGMVDLNRDQVEELARALLDWVKRQEERQGATIGFAGFPPHFAVLSRTVPISKSDKDDK